MPPSFTQVQVSSAAAADASRAARARRLVATLAWTGAFLTLCVLVLAAAMRLQAAGLGCEPWPECYRSASAHAVETPAWARLAHRISAMLVSLCALTIAVVCFGTRVEPRLPRFRPALVVVGVAVLAGLGRFSGPTASASVALANLLLGLGLAITFASLAVTPPRTRDMPRSADWLTAAVLAITTVLGGIASTHRLAGECADLLGCGVVSGAGSVAAWIVNGHRVLGILAVVWTLAWAVRSYRAGAKGGWVLLLCAASLALLGLGAAQASGIGALPVALMHHAASGIALVAAVACVGRDGPRARPQNVADHPRQTDDSGRRSP